jgi:hypothetical protein
MFDRKLRFPVGRLCGGLFLAALGAVALAAGPARPSSNRSPDPDATYGRCHEQGSAIGSKWTLVAYAGETAEDVIALQVLQCRHWTGGPNGKVDCDTVNAGGVPYAYCARFFNDGAGNDIAIGVLRRDAVTDALGQYTGCSKSQVPQSKLALAQAAGVDPRGIDGIVTLGCAPSGGAAVQAPVRVACPAEPNPYALCLATRNDGHGNAVMVGIVAANGPGDPNTLYGECNSATGIQPGFTYKADTLRQAGVAMQDVRSVDVAGCQVPWGMGGWVPDHPEKWDCHAIPGIMPLIEQRYDFCVVGTDAHGNGLVFGVHSR